MTTSIVIGTNKLTENNQSVSQKDKQFNEDSTTSLGVSVGRNITISKQSTQNVSGVKHVFFPALNNNNRYGESTSVDALSIDANLESKSSQGISVKRFNDTQGDNLPYLYIGNMPYPNTVHERFTPFWKADMYGIQEHIIKNDQFLVFDDLVQEYSNQNYINKSKSEQSYIYPALSGSRYSSEFDTNATIEILEIRSGLIGPKRINTLIGSSDIIHRGFFSGISCDLMGDNEQLKKGGNVIIDSKIDVKELNLVNNIPYNDSKQKTFLNNKLKPISYDGLYTRSLQPFNDKRSEEYLDNKYDFAGTDDSMKNLLYGNGIEAPYSRMSEIGTRYQSATSGFVYDSTTIGSTTLGTDSIAFGGLKGG